MSMLARMLCSAGLVAWAAPAAAQITVSGTVRGVDGRVPTRADVVLRAERDTARTAQAPVDSAGRFRVTLAGDGPVRLRVVGVGYALLERSLPVQAGDSISVAATLAGDLSGGRPGVLVAVAASDVAVGETDDAPAMARLGGPGPLRAELRARADTVPYRVVEYPYGYVTPRGAVRVRLAPDGVYEGLAVARGGTVTVELDTAGAVRGGVAALEPADSSLLAQRIRAIDALRRASEPACAAVPKTLPQVDSLTRDLAVLTRFIATYRCGPAAREGAQVLRRLRASPQLWGVGDVVTLKLPLVAALSQLRGASQDDALLVPAAIGRTSALLDSLVRDTRDTTTRRVLLAAGALLVMPFDTTLGQRYAAEFHDLAPAASWAAEVRTATGYNRVLRVGAPVPPFRLRSADDSTRVFTDSTLRGTAYVLDVWATWCKDCLVELPAMRALMTRYEARGLRLLSVSVDAREETPATFRRTREPMPWWHAWVGNDDRTSPIGHFEVTWLPTTILVGKDGVIRAVRPKLGSRAFDAQVEEALR